MFPVIDAFKCNGCEICVKRCPAQIMGMINGIAAYHRMLCEECGICAEVCPIDAVHFELPRRHGEAELHGAYRFKR